MSTWEEFYISNILTELVIRKFAAEHKGEESIISMDLRIFASKQISDLFFRWTRLPSLLFPLFWNIFWAIVILILIIMSSGSSFGECRFSIISKKVPRIRFWLLTSQGVSFQWRQNIIFCALNFRSKNTRIPLF